MNLDALRRDLVAKQAAKAAYTAATLHHRKESRPHTETQRSKRVGDADALRHRSACRSDTAMGRVIDTLVPVTAPGSLRTPDAGTTPDALANYAAGRLPLGRLFVSARCDFFRRDSIARRRSGGRESRADRSPSRHVRGHTHIRSASGGR